jgi:hypothetical protein
VLLTFPYCCAVTDVARFADFGTDDTHPSPPLFRPDDLQRHRLFGVGGSRYCLGVPVGICSRVVPPVGKQSCTSDDFERADQGKRSVFLFAS